MPFDQRGPVKHCLQGVLLLLLSGPQIGPGAEFPLPLPGNDAVGEVTTVTSRYEDTLSDIARANDLGYLEMSEANPGVDPWLPGEGLEIVLPTHYLLPPGPREGIIINLAELRLYYFPQGEARVVTYPLGIGREGWSTPTGLTRVTGKKPNPSWTPPESIRQEHEEKGSVLPSVVMPGPDNPLGEYAIYLAMPGYLIHGTNKPFGVGMRVSHGCIRLYPEDIAALFPRVSLNTRVSIINQPYKLGWIDGRLHIEAHQPLSEQRTEQGIDWDRLNEAVTSALGGSSLTLDREALVDAVMTNSGLPVPISSRLRY